MAVTRAIGVAATVLASAFGTAAGAAVAADPAVNFAGSSSVFAGDCRGQDASLAGSGNTATIRGACRAFQVAGNDNRVLVDMMAGGTIKVFGNNNKVSWTANGEVEVTAVGPGNTVTRAR
jgi:hypothetical protein